MAADADKAPQSIMLFRQDGNSHPPALNAPSPTLTKNCIYEAPKITLFNYRSYAEYVLLRRLLQDYLPKNALTVPAV